HASDLAHDLATIDVKQNNLPAALNDLSAHVKELFAISCRFKAEGPVPEMEPGTINQLYKIAQEAVTNAIKHGKAKKVGISLSNGSDHIVLTVQNDGKPFPDMKSRSTGMGLRIMNYRASLIGASLEIKGTGPNGTLVTVPKLCSFSFASSPSFFQSYQIESGTLLSRFESCCRTTNAAWVSSVTPLLWVEYPHSPLRIGNFCLLAAGAYWSINPRSFL